MFFMLLLHVIFIGGVLAPAPGYWRLTPYSTVMLKCPWPFACAGDGSGSASDGTTSRRLSAATTPTSSSTKPAATCASGYQGPLCAVCVNNYYFSSSTQRCLSCSGQGPLQLAILIFVPLIMLGLLAYIALFTDLSIDDQFAVANNEVTFAQDPSLDNLKNLAESCEGGQAGENEGHSASQQLADGLGIDDGGNDGTSGVGTGNANEYSYPSFLPLCCGDASHYLLNTLSVTDHVILACFLAYLPACLLACLLAFFPSFTHSGGDLVGAMGNMKENLSNVVQSTIGSNGGGDSMNQSAYSAIDDVKSNPETQNAVDLLQEIKDATGADKEKDGVEKDDGKEKDKDGKKKKEETDKAGNESNDGKKVEVKGEALQVNHEANITWHDVPDAGNVSGKVEVAAEDKGDPQQTSSVSPQENIKRKSSIRRSGYGNGGNPNPPSSCCADCGVFKKILRFIKAFVPEIKIVITVYQIVTTFPFALNLQYPQFVTKFWDAMSFVNFSALYVGSPQCYTKYDYVVR